MTIQFTIPDITRAPDRVVRMARDIVVREGGVADHAEDKGGFTKHGVSLRYAKGIGLDLDGDGDVDRDDILLVDPTTAVCLFVDDFFFKPRIDRLPAPVHELLFDAAVHHGQPRAVIFAQEVINLAGFGQIDEDGRCGPVTQQRAALAAAEMGSYFVNAVVEQRKAFMWRIVQRDPSQSKFIKGWIRRAESFRVPA